MKSLNYSPGVAVGADPWDHKQNWMNYPGIYRETFGYVQARFGNHRKSSENITLLPLSSSKNRLRLLVKGGDKNG